MEYFPNQSLVCISFILGAGADEIGRIALDAATIEKQRQWNLPRESVVGVDDCFVGMPSGSGLTKRKLACFSFCDQKSTIALTTNGSDGWNSLAYRAGIRTGAKVITATFSDEKDGVARGFCVYSGQDELRAVRAQIDTDGWVFSQRGSTVAGEDVSAYSRRRIRDRLTNESVAEVCVALGVPDFRGVGLRGPGIFLEEQ